MLLFDRCNFDNPAVFVIRRPLTCLLSILKRTGTHPCAVLPEPLKISVWFAAKRTSFGPNGPIVVIFDVFLPC